MPWLGYDDVADRFRIGFRLGDQQFKRSLKTSDEREARALLGRAAYKILQIERGDLELPPDIDPATFILSDGKRTGKENNQKFLTLKELFELYQEKLPPGAKEENTLEGERIHFKHLLRHLKGGTLTRSVTVDVIQEYVAKRSKDRWRGKYISSQTVKKELTTFRLVWNWAAKRGYVVGHSPVNGIEYSKPISKQIFRTTDEIERIIQRGGLSKEQKAALWGGLYLTREEVRELLAHVESTARHAFVFPMFAFAAHTGARRSEILRAEIDDFDFRLNTVQIREKKKDHEVDTTYRRVDMTSLLSKTMKAFFTDHPGGQFAISRNGESPISIREAHGHFKRAIKGSKWEGRIRGFHMLRHSFCSNLAGMGVDQRVIDSYVGHTTLEMQKRYQHLAPSVTRQAIELLMT